MSDAGEKMRVMFASLHPSAPEGSTDFVLAEEGPKWRKGCPPSVVLFATDGRGAVYLIDSQGPDAAYIRGDSLIEGIFVDELRDWKFPGIFVWEGKVRGYRDYWGEYDETNEGEIRPMTADEARALRENDHLWDGALWIEDWKP